MAASGHALRTDGPTRLDCSRRPLWQLHLAQPRPASSHRTKGAEGRFGDDSVWPSTAMGSWLKGGIRQLDSFARLTTTIFGNPRREVRIERDSKTPTHQSSGSSVIYDAQDPRHSLSRC